MDTAELECKSNDMLVKLRGFLCVCVCVWGGYAVLVILAEVHYINTEINWHGYSFKLA